MREKLEERRARQPKTAEQALASLMRLASRAEKSSGDALRLMRGWGVPQSEWAAVLDKLIEGRFIDDRRYAEAYVREKSRLNGWGAHKIRATLTTKGVAREIIDRALEQVDRESAAGRLAEMLTRKLRTVKADSRYELKGKLMRYGLSLGYDYEQVAQAIKDFAADETEE